MEFKQLVGGRRSTRYWQPWRPVEDEKLQVILETIYRAPRVLEVDFIRAGVLRKEQIPEAELAAMKGPTTTTQIDLCPVYIWIYADLQALEAALSGAALEELMAVGALNPSHGWTPARLQSTILPDVYQAILQDDVQVPLIPRPPEDGDPAPTYSLKLLTLARWAIGIASEHALLAAVDQGLGVQLSAVNATVPRRIMGVPDHWLSWMPLLVGYSAEGPEAGGQRPREPLSEDFHEGKYGNPFLPDRAVEERLADCGMFQAAAPLPWRWAELRRISRMFGLPE